MARVSDWMTWNIFVVFTDLAILPLNDKGTLNQSYVKLLVITIYDDKFWIMSL